jgi:hypothetical protein
MLPGLGAPFLSNPLNETTEQRIKRQLNELRQAGKEKDLDKIERLFYQIRGEDSKSGNAGLYSKVTSQLDPLYQSYQTSKFQMTMSDQQNAQSIQTQIAADAQKQQMQRWKIMQDTQTKVFEIQQDVTANKAQTQDKMYRKWDEYIRQ